MKCIRCGHDCTYPQRSDGNCPNCHKRFALEPRTGDLFTDAFFEAAVKAVSSEGKVRWGLDNLYYEACRRKLKKTDGCGCAFLGFVVPNIILLGPGQVSNPGVLMGGALVGALLAAGLYQMGKSQASLLPREVFNAAWSKWAAQHGTPSTLIVPAPPKKKGQAAESDVGDYSFDRAVICDEPRTVDLLLANNFHFENNCAILTIDGYPAHAFHTVKAMLLRNPRLRVWALHDATPAGCRLAYTLRHDPGWFPRPAEGKGVEIIDVGLRPQHATPLKKLWEPVIGTVEIHPALSDSEMTWLSRNRLSLAAIRPEQLIKRLFRSMSSVSAGSDDFFVDYVSFSTDAGTSDGGGDSFG